MRDEIMRAIQSVAGSCADWGGSTPYLIDMAMGKPNVDYIALLEECQDRCTLYAQQVESHLLSEDEAGRAAAPYLFICAGLVLLNEV